MVVFLAHAAYITIQNLPAHLLCYYPVRAQLRCSRARAALAVGCCLLTQALLYGWLAGVKGGGAWVEYAFAPVFLAVYVLCVQLDVFRLLFFYLFTASYTLAAKGLALFLQARLLGAGGGLSLAGLGLQLAVTLITIPLMFYMLEHTSSQVLHTDAPLLWRSIWLAPCLTIAIALLFTWDIRSDMTASFEFLLARVAVPFSTLAVYALLIRSLGAVRARAEAEALSRQQEQLLALQHNQHAQLQRHIAQTRQAHHDLRQHLKLISAYLDRGDEAALRDYIAAYRRTLPQDTGLHYCANIAADTVIRYYAGEAQQQGAEFAARTQLPEKLPVSEPDLCALLGNLLENALEACRSPQQESGAYIRLNMLLEGGALTVTVDNSCPLPPQQKEGRLISGKTGRFGIGTQSVRAIAERYQGAALFEWEAGEFRASVLLRLPQSEAEQQER